MANLDLFVRPNTATFSRCGRYRYLLTRELGGDRSAVFIGANPSKATADDDDQTMAKDVGFARRWKYGRVVKANAYGYIATLPADLKRAAKAGVDVNGPDNDEAIREAIRIAMTPGSLLVITCGNDIPIFRIKEVMALVRMAGAAPLCLGTNKNGSPKHELYLPYATPLVPYRGELLG